MRIHFLRMTSLALALLLSGCTTRPERPLTASEMSEQARTILAQCQTGTLCEAEIISQMAKRVYADYDCQRLLKAMEYKANEAKALFTNHEDEESVRKVAGGVVSAGVGSAMASSLILTPLGALIAGGLMLGGTFQALDGLGHEELSDAEKHKLRAYKIEFEEMKQKAIQKKCDYYAIPTLP